MVTLQLQTFIHCPAKQTSPSTYSVGLSAFVDFVSVHHCSNIVTSPYGCYPGAGMIISQGLMRMHSYAEVQEFVEGMNWPVITAGGRLIQTYMSIECYHLP